MGERTGGWERDELAAVDAAAELEIAVRRDDGALRAWTPVWVVRVDEQVLVRSWYRRGTGWFGAVLRSRHARVRVPGLEADVTVDDLGDADPVLSAAVDTAYRAKYRAGAGSMVTPEAVSTTLRLVPSGR
ncbi:DUF2255 family protein [Microlunatus flavus]|uniref:DUF2255 family protein n=1 Tax=Microlunatus flavus TaxID=1036181 RepID=A0A1H8Z8G3_9ACTN|nr:DUF2255 family protein [Microlunatus flavus]SEP60631.1 hypothetical protein SAMN05421756_101138 [Microlunatus flavus]